MFVSVCVYICSLGLELAHCSGFWGTPDWAAAEELQDTERPQKRVRTIFNLKQLEELENVFTKQHNLVGKKRAQLAARLNLTENQVRAGDCCRTVAVHGGRPEGPG